MFPPSLVGSIGCLLPIALLLCVIAPFAVRAEYRRNQRHWPQAKWIARLLLIGLESALVGTLAASGGILVIAVGNLPLTAYLDPRWDVAMEIVEGIVGLTALAVLGWAVLYIIQARRYGLPPRTPSAQPHSDSV
jgi:hypothetical protein